MSKSYWVYLITDKPFGTLYLGMTSDLARRMYEHRNGLYEGFSKIHKLKMLVWCEEFQQVYEAIVAEKRLKKWHRDWKIDLVKRANPKWLDLYEHINR